MTLATELTAQAADAPHLPGLLDATIAAVGAPARFLADVGLSTRSGPTVMI